MNLEFCLDANVLITGWNVTYPPRIFKPLWDKLALHASRIAIIEPVYQEIDPISQSHRGMPRDELEGLYPLRFWLEASPFQVLKPGEPESLLSLQLEMEYEVSDTSKGAGQNDITLIACAKIHGLTVVTLEGEQKQRPGKKSNTKIPLVCSDQSVPCITFIDLLDSLQLTV